MRLPRRLAMLVSFCRAARAAVCCALRLAGDAAHAGLMKAVARAAIRAGRRSGQDARRLVLATLPASEPCRTREQRIRPTKGGGAPTGAIRVGRTVRCGSGLSAARSPLGAPPRSRPDDRTPGLSPGRASRHQESGGVTLAIGGA